MNQPFSKYVKQWLAEVYGFGAFSCHQLTSPQTHFVLRHRGNRASLYPSPPFGEHLHPSWLSFFSPTFSAPPLAMTFGQSQATERPWAQELTRAEVT